VAFFPVDAFLLAGAGVGKTVFSEFGFYFGGGVGFLFSFVVAPVIQVNR
jgi:hypothetical protein